jgi:hypothetical protein
VINTQPDDKDLSDDELMARVEEVLGKTRPKKED